MEEKDLNEENVESPDDEEEIEEYDDDRVTRRDVLKAVGEIFDDYKQSYKKASKKDKLAILAVVLPLLITFVTAFVGIVVANIGQSLSLHKTEITGLIIMGLGMGGFFLTLVILIIWSKIKEKR